MKNSPLPIQQNVWLPSQRIDLNILGIDWGILQSVLYFDLFDYPLTAKEIHRYLGIQTSYQIVEHVLNTSRLVSDYLQVTNGYYTFLGRSHLVEKRLHYSEIARDSWSRFHKMFWIIKTIPYIRMVALTGTLAMNIATKHSDIDLFIVTEHNKVWTTRASIILLAYLSNCFAIKLCPNYLISEDNLVFRDRNLYVAHEIAQMIPVLGMPVYNKLRKSNDWTIQYLPNADSPPESPVNFQHPEKSSLSISMARGSLEKLLRRNFGNKLENWESSRKINKLNQLCTNTNEPLFTPDVCKGHFGNHMQITLQKYQSRLFELESMVFDE